MHHLKEPYQHRRVQIFFLRIANLSEIAAPIAWGASTKVILVHTVQITEPIHAFNEMIL